MLYVLCCYIIRTLTLEGLLAMKAQTIIYGGDPKCGLSTFRSNSKILELN